MQRQLVLPHRLHLCQLHRGSNIIPRPRSSSSSPRDAPPMLARNRRSASAGTATPFMNYIGPAGTPKGTGRQLLAAPIKGARAKQSASEWAAQISSIKTRKARQRDWPPTPLERETLVEKRAVGDFIAAPDFAWAGAREPAGDTFSHFSATSPLWRPSPNSTGGRSRFIFIASPKAPESKPPPGRG